MHNQKEFAMRTEPAGGSTPTAPADGTPVHVTGPAAPGPTNQSDADEIQSGGDKQQPDFLRKAYDFLIGDDIGNAFGANKSIGQRLLGGVNLALDATLVVPGVDEVTVGIKAAEEGGKGLTEGGKVASEAEKAAKLAELERARAGAIAKGEHAIGEVEGKSLAHPSQDLSRIESLEQKAGEPHTEFFHVAKDDAFLQRRLTDPLKKADGSVLTDRAGNPKYLGVASSFADGKTAQEAVNKTFADPANQAKIARWLTNGSKGNLALTEEVGKEIGSGIRRADLLAGTPKHIATSDVRVVLKADKTYPEGYKVLTAYPDVKP